MAVTRAERGVHDVLSVPMVMAPLMKFRWLGVNPVESDHV